MLPLQFILLLIVVSLPDQIAMAQRAESGVAAAVIPPNFTWALLASLSLLLSQGFVGAYVMLKTRRAIHHMHEPGASSTAIAMRTESLFFRARMLTIVITGIHLFSSPLPDAVFYRRDQTLILRHVPLLPEVLFLLPAMAAWLAIWTAAYLVETAARERAMPYRLAQAIPVHDMPSLGSFILLQARHNLFPLLFLFIVSGFDKLAAWSPGMAIAASFGSAAVMLLAVPVLLT